MPDIYSRTIDTNNAKVLRRNTWGDAYWVPVATVYSGESPDRHLSARELVERIGRAYRMQDSLQGCIETMEELLELALTGVNENGTYHQRTPRKGL